MFYPSPISPFFKKELKAYDAGTKRYTAETDRMKAAGGGNRQAAGRTGGGMRNISSRASSPVYSEAEVPYLPEDREKGRLGNIMKASPEELRGMYERMPEEERPVHLIRGERQSYFSPGTRQEYGDLRTAMTGFRQRTEPKEAKGKMLTPYQAEQLRRGDKEFTFKVNQARDKAVSEGMAPWLESKEGYNSNKLQQEVKSNELMNAFDFANLPEEEARANAENRGIELKTNKAGKERWYNVFGRPIGGTKEKTKLRDIAPEPMESFEDYTPPQFTSSAFGRDVSVDSDEMYAAQKGEDSRYAIRRGAERIADQAKGVLGAWLKSKQPQVKYPFSRSMMGQ